MLKGAQRALNGELLRCQAFNEVGDSTADSLLNVECKCLRRNRANQLLEVMDPTIGGGGPLGVSMSVPCQFHVWSGDLEEKKLTVN